MKTVKLKISSEEARNSIVLAMASSGIKVWTETMEMPDGVFFTGPTPIFVCFEVHDDEAEETEEEDAVEDNIPQKWYFTFGTEHLFPYGYYISHHEDWSKARAEMSSIFGNKWAFQYGSAEKAGVDKFALVEVILDANGISHYKGSVNE